MEKRQKQEIDSTKKSIQNQMDELFKTELALKYSTNGFKIIIFKDNFDNCYTATAHQPLDIPEGSFTLQNTGWYHQQFELADKETIAHNIADFIHKIENLQ